MADDERKKKAEDRNTSYHDHQDDRVINLKNKKLAIDSKKSIKDRDIKKIAKLMKEIKKIEKDQDKHDKITTRLMDRAQGVSKDDSRLKKIADFIKNTRDDIIIAKMEAEAKVKPVITQVQDAIKKEVISRAEPLITKVQDVKESAQEKARSAAEPVITKVQDTKEFIQADGHTRAQLKNKQKEAEKLNLENKLEEHKALQEKVVDKTMYKIKTYNTTNTANPVIQEAQKATREQQNETRRNEKVETRTAKYATRTENKIERLNKNKTNLKQDLIDSAKNKRDDIKVRAELASIEAKDAMKEKAKEIGSSVRDKFSKAAESARNNLPSRSNSKGKGNDGQLR